MSSPLERPIVHYGIGVMSALLLASVGLLLDGTIQLVFFGIAAFELIVLPQILKTVAAGEATD